MKQLRFGEYTTKIKDPEHFEELAKRFKALISTAEQGKYYITFYEYAPENFKEKTLRQLKYLHGIVLKGLQEAFRSTGELDLNPTEIRVKKELKRFCGWGEEINCECKNLRYFKEDSFRDASKPELAKIIDTAIQLAAERGVVIPDPIIAESEFACEQKR